MCRPRHRCNNVVARRGSGKKAATGFYDFTMFLLRRGGHGGGARQQMLLFRTALCQFFVPRQEDRLATLFSRPKWTSSLGSGFDGSSFSDDEDSPNDQARKLRFEYGEPGSVSLRGHEIDFMVDEFNKVCNFFSRSLNPTHLVII